MINDVSILIQNKYISLIPNAVLVAELTDGAVIQINKYNTVTVSRAIEIVDFAA